MHVSWLADSPASPILTNGAALLTLFAVSRRLSQVFLRDKNILRKIVAAAELSPGEWVVEVGAGRGDLTRELLATGARVVAFEIDRNLLSYLREEFSLAVGREVHLVGLDYLRSNTAELLSHLGARPPVAMVSNIPYHITAPILEKLARERNLYSRILLTVQKEVAERVTAPPGSKPYGSLTVYLAYHFASRVLFTISRQCFRPVPQVDSAVLQLLPLSTPPVRVRSEETLFSLVRACFHMRRKKLRTVIRSQFPEVDPAWLERTSGISLDRRGETLSLEEFGALEAALSSKLSG